MYKTGIKRLKKSDLKGKKIIVQYNSEDDDSIGYEVVKEFIL